MERYIMSSKGSVTSNFFWRFFERCGAQGVTFLVSIVLARLLDPSVYGTIALITIFTTILNVFVDSGFGNALIQKKNADGLDFSSVFYFNITICSILYIIMFFSAPYIAEFYKLPELKNLIRVLSLVLIISGVKNVQQAYVSRNMMFKKFFFSTIGETIGAAVVGIVLAYCGYGVWALVFQMLFNSLVDTVILWFTVKWRPTKQFSFIRLKELFSYGWKLLISSLIDTVYLDIRSLIIGKMYSKNDLAFYNQGEKFPKLVVTNINSSIDSVLLPTLSKFQDDSNAVREMTRRAIKTSTYIMMPLMIGLAVCSEPLVRLILTEKWVPCVFFLRIFCFTYAFYPIHTANLNAIKAMGRSDLFLILEIIKKSFGIILLLISMWFGVKAMACSLLISTFINQIINSWPNKKLLNYSYLNQFSDMLPQIVLSLLMGTIIYVISFFHLNSLLTLVLQFFTGLSIYVFLSIVFHIESFYYIYNKVKTIKLVKRSV